MLILRKFTVLYILHFIFTVNFNLHIHLSNIWEALNEIREEFMTQAKVLAYISGFFRIYEFEITRKYPLRGYILGVLTHTTDWDRLWEGDVF